MKRPNPLPPEKMTAAERRAELCGFPAEQARIIHLLVRRVTVTGAGLEVDFRREGIAGVIREMVAPNNLEAAE